METSFFALAALLVSLPAHGQDTHAPDLQHIRAIVQFRSVRAQTAWERKDPRFLIDGPDTAIGLRGPDGSTRTFAEMRADLAHRMALVVRIDSMYEIVDSVQWDGDSALVRTRQRFVRAVRLPEGGERVRVSGVRHWQWYRKVNGAWAAVGPIQESDQEAYWADGSRG